MELVASPPPVCSPSACSPWMLSGLEPCQRQTGYSYYGTAFGPSTNFGAGYAKCEADGAAVYAAVAAGQARPLISDSDFDSESDSDSDS